MAWHRAYIQHSFETQTEARAHQPPAATPSARNYFTESIVAYVGDGLHPARCKRTPKRRTIMTLFLIYAVGQKHGKHRNGPEACFIGVQ